jgi:membrane protein
MPESPAPALSEVALPDWIPGWANRFLNRSAPQFLWRLFMEIGDDDVPGLSAEMAYRFLFALFPFLIFLAAVVGFIGTWLGSTDLFAQVMQFVSPFFPPEVQVVLAEWVQGVQSTQSPGLLTAGVAGALWGAAGGVGTLIKGLNRAYDVVENRSFWRSQALSLLTTVVLVLLMVGGVAFVTIGERLITWAVDTFELGDRVWVLWNLIKGPGITVAFCVMLAVTYALLPNQRLALRHTWPGALAATIAWQLLTMGFGFYLTHFASFDEILGSLGAAFVLMFWMYAVGFILLVGGEINALVSGRKQEERAATYQHPAP